MADVVFTVVDAGEADYHRKEKESDTIDGHVTKVPYVYDEDANASLSSIKEISDLVDLGGAQRLPGNGASQALTVPANTLIMRVDAEGGAVRISHTGDASATTIPRVPEEAIDYIPLKSTDAPQFYGASASVIANINYYGART